MVDLGSAGTRLTDSLLPRELAPRELLRLSAVSRWNAARGVRVGLSAAVLLALLTGANLATPVYPLLQQRLSLTALDTTLLFTVYVFALMPVLAAVGHWSDHLGRRALLLPAVALSAAGDALFATAGTFTQLAAGRAVQGVAVGMATGAAGAALTDLLPDRPGLAARLTLACSAGGVAAGPVVGAALAHGEHPVHVPFLAHAVLLLALCVPLALLHPRSPGHQTPDRRAAAPEGRPARAALRPRALALPSAGRRTFLLAAGTGFVSYAVFGVYLSLAPGYSRALLHTDSRMTGAVVAALLLAASGAAQLAVPAAPGRLVPVLGMAGLAAGLGTVVAAGPLHAPALLVAGSLVGGACQGVAFRSLFTAACAAMDPERRGSQLSAFWVIVYLGSSLPIVAVGAAAQHVGLQAAFSGFAAVACAACLALSAAAARRA
ncbi:MFS transporter [Streptomyces sp. NPDC001380]|uniref:MFS transporter n=1 Tax=Streptomyces sp. NPDC001380 TaxID=3364566 RepID=UPI0036B01D51